MTDDKKLTGQQDQSSVNANEDYEVEDLHQKYPHLSHQIVKDAVVKFGPVRKNIEKHLDSPGGRK